MPVLVIGANLPDIDATCTIYGIEGLAMRRGLTHGPIAWVILPLPARGHIVVVRPLAGETRKAAGRTTPGTFRLAVRAELHRHASAYPLFDWFNNHGIRFLEPFSHRWFYGDTLFIIDIWLWLGMGFATWFSLRREKRGGNWRLPARAALLAAAAYIGCNFAYSRVEIAADSDRAILIPSPVPIAFWERQRISGNGDGIWWVDGQKLGDLPLDRCSLASRRKTDPQVDAFLFWSRAPFVSEERCGAWVLSDARFSNGVTRGRFAVELPEGTCAALK